MELPNEKAKVMVQAHTSFVPGTPYPPGGVGGEPPRTDALVVVVRGTANFEAIARRMKFSAIKEWDDVAWNSKSNKLEPPAPVNKQEFVPDPDTLIPVDKGAPVQRALSDAADSLKDSDGVRQLLEARMNYARKDDLDLPRMLATYAYAAILDGREAQDTKKMVANLYEVLNDSERIYVRQSAVTATSAWLARGPANTPIFVSMLSDDKRFPPDDANLAAQLLRGYAAATYGPAAWLTSKVDDLIKYLDSDYIIIREAALGNLIIYYDIPYIYSEFARVRFTERTYETFLRVKKPPEEVTKKIRPFVNRDMRRGELLKELTAVLTKSESEQYLDTIIDFTTIRGPFTNVGIKPDDYSRFIEAWKERAIEIKDWMQLKSSTKAEFPGKK